MTLVNLPTGSNNTGANEWADVYNNDNALATAINGELDNDNLSGSAGITRANLAADAKGVAGKWYDAKVIATEQSRESTEFGTLSTADEIKEVVLPENGLLQVAFHAQVKSSVSGAGRAALFIGSNQLKDGVGTLNEAGTSGTGFLIFSSRSSGLAAIGEGSFVTTGQAFATSSNSGGLCLVRAAAGTYAISVQYKAASGSVTAKERKLWVEVHGA